MVLFAIVINFSVRMIIAEYVDWSKLRFKFLNIFKIFV